MRILRTVLGHYRSCLPLIVLATALRAAGTLAEAALLVVLVPLAQQLVDAEAEPLELAGIAVSGDQGTLAAVAVVSALAATTLQIAGSWVTARAAAGWQRRTRMELVAAYARADLPTQSSDRGGRLVALSGQSVNQSATGLVQIANGMGGLVSLALLVTAALVVAPLGALGIMVGGVALFAALLPLSRLARRLQRRLAGLNLEIADELHEIVAASTEISVFHVPDEAVGRVARLTAEQEGVRTRAVTASNANGPLFRLGGVLLVVAIATVGSAASGSMTPAVLGTAALLLYRSLAYSQVAQAAFHAVNEVEPHLERLAVDVARYREHPAPDGPAELAAPSTIAFEGVGYRYDDERPALEGISLELHRGQIVGVVGPSGSGKTTLAQLLLRLRRPDAGRILVDGTPAESFSAASWARHVAIVPQSTHLFHGTVAENIAFFRPHVDRADVERAARLAGVAEAVEALPEGYDTPVGKAQRNLSGGQVQRLSIARALAGQPSVLVLDEPTSALDVHAEAVVQETLGLLRGQVLVVVIAHRLSTLDICDRLLVIRDGRLCDDGTPAAVLARADLPAEIELADAELADRPVAPPDPAADG